MNTNANRPSDSLTHSANARRRATENVSDGTARTFDVRSADPANVTKGGNMTTNAKTPAKPKAPAANAKTYRPEQLAANLGISGKIVRAYLRQTYTRSPEAKGTTWVLNAKQATDTLAHFKSRQPKSA